MYLQASVTESVRNSAAGDFGTIFCGGKKGKHLLVIKLIWDDSTVKPKNR